MAGRCPIANAIDILIRAIWQGGSQTNAAQREIQNLGNTVSQAGIEFAAMQARSGLLQSEMGRLAKEVALGNLTVDEARGKYNRFAGSLATFEGQAQKTGTSFSAMAGKIGVVTVALGIATVAGRKFFTALERGAGLELTARRFDRLAESVGSTGDALRTDLQEATSGMVSSAQAMALATDLIGLGLVNTHDDAVRLGRIVTELDADIGELTLALANQTTRRFDQLGISLQGFDERLQQAKETMSDEEAFTMAFLEQAEAQIERVGGASQTTAGDIRRLQADWAALNEELDTFLAKRFGPVLAASSGRTGQEFIETAQGAVEAAESVRDLEQANKDLDASFKELALSAPNAAGLVVLSLSDARAELARELALMTESAEEFDREFTRIFGSTEAVVILNRAMAETSEEFFNMARAAREAESADRVLIQAHQELNQETEQLITTTEEFIELLTTSHDTQLFERELEQVARFGQELEELNRISREGLPDRVGQRAGRVAERRQLEQDRELNEERADLFQSFQADLNDINAREEEQRLDITAQFEERRTELIADYNQRRLDEEADFQRRQARQDAQLARDIADVRSDTAERQADLRDDANRRLEDLEEDHLDRMADIIEDAEIGLEEAASRLDARAVQNIKRNRDRALAEEEERYTEQREQIQEELQRRLEMEQEAAEERIAELEEFHERRQREEEEDRRLRLQRMERDHQRQLQELRDQERRRLQQLRQQAQAERNEREQQYTEERFQLRDHWDNKAEMERQWQNIILEQEEEFWDQRLGLVGGGSAGGVEPGERPDGGDTGGGGGTGGGGSDTGTWSRYRMEYEALQIANPSSTDEALAWQRYFNGLSDPQLAAWIEQHSDIDVPGYMRGGDVARDLFALVGERGPELVRLPGGSHVFDAQTTSRMMSGRGVGTVNISEGAIQINESRRPGQTGREVREELVKLINEVTA